MTPIVSGNRPHAEQIRPDTAELLPQCAHTMGTEPPGPIIPLKSRVNNNLLRAAWWSAIRERRSGAHQPLTSRTLAISDLLTLLDGGSISCDGSARPRVRLRAELRSLLRLLQDRRGSLRRVRRQRGLSRADGRSASSVVMMEAAAQQMVRAHQTTARVVQLCHARNLPHAAASHKIRPSKRVWRWQWRIPTKS